MTVLPSAWMKRTPTFSVQEMERNQENLMNKCNDINLTPTYVSALSGLYSVIMARVTLTL
jgi:hypothetical protein